MKTIHVLILAFFIFSAPFQILAQTSKTDLKINYSHVHKESSKDSHSIIEKWVLENGALNYSKSYTGRLGKKSPEKKQQNLSDEQLILVKKLLNEKELYKNIPSPKYSDFKSPYTAIHVNLILKKNTESFEIDLYEVVESITKNPTYSDIKTLENLLNSFLKK
ncbi:MAG: hypothetical protein SFY56_03780 [Bacteroidota bacterium]|nr:hypothetical protein [Bacteroidota bacterium]